jgi:molecular chaperone GrpE
MNAENEKEELLEEETADEMPEETAEPAEDAAEGDEDSEVSAEVSTEEAVEAERERYLRRYAEFDNFRKRTAREKTEVYGDATARCIEQLLPVVDNFERAMEAPCSDAQYQSGMEMIFGQMKNFLEKLGVTEVESLGAEFDPNVHNAIKQGEATEEFPEGTVCEVFQKGYMLKDKMIRPAMVAVAN